MTGFVTPTDPPELRVQVVQNGTVYAAHSSRSPGHRVTGRIGGGTRSTPARWRRRERGCSRTGRPGASRRGSRRASACGAAWRGRSTTASAGPRQWRCPSVEDTSAEQDVAVQRARAQPGDPVAAGRSVDRSSEHVAIQQIDVRSRCEPAVARSRTRADRANATATPRRSMRRVRSSEIQWLNPLAVGGRSNPPR